MHVCAQPAKCCHQRDASGLIPHMDAYSEFPSHVATGVAMGGPNRPVRPVTKVFDLAPNRARAYRLVAIVTLVALAAGCSTANPNAEPEQPSTPDGAAAPAEPDTGEQPEGEPDGGGADVEDLAAVWEAFHTAWVEQAAEGDPDPVAFTGVAVDPGAVAETLAAQRGDSRLVTTDAELWPRFDVQGDNAEVADCAIVAQHPDGQPNSVATITVRWEATAVVTDDGWRIQDARPLELFCIAEELNDELIAAYVAFRDAKDAAWDPPDPDHPDLERTMAGEQLEFIRELLAEHSREGIVIRDPAPTESAVVFEVGIGQATVSDCAEQTSERGAFDQDTGDRLDELIPPIREGQLDLQSVDLQRGEDGRWRVVDQAGTRDTNCEPGSTSYVVS